MIAKPLSNYNWLNSICNNSLIKEDWYNEQVCYIDYRKCITSSTAQEYIKACDIIGITNDHYFENTPSLSWFELLENLSRFYKFRDSIKGKNDKDLINLIHSRELFPPDFKRVCEWNGRYFILTGHHRLTIAKFLNIDNILVEVNHVHQISQ